MREQYASRRAERARDAALNQQRPDRPMQQQEQARGRVGSRGLSARRSHVTGIQLEASERPFSGVGDSKARRSCCPRRSVDSFRCRVYAAFR